MPCRMTPTPMAVISDRAVRTEWLPPRQNPALAGQNVYKSRQVQDQQIARLISKVGQP